MLPVGPSEVGALLAASESPILPPSQRRDPDDHLSVTVVDPQRSASRDEEHRSAVERLLQLPRGIDQKGTTRTGMGVRPGALGDDGRRDTLGNDEETWDETETLAALAHTTTPHTAKVVDIYEDVEYMFQEERRGQSAPRRFLIWVSRHRWSLGIVTVSLTLSFVLWILSVQHRLLVPASQTAWLWSAIPGLIALTILASYIIEVTIINVAAFIMTSPPWFADLFRQSTSGYIRVSAFGIVMDSLVFRWWLNSTAPGDLNPTLIDNCFVAMYVVAIVLIVRNFFNEVGEMLAAEKSFGKRVDALNFLEGIMLDLCCRSPTDRAALAQIRANRTRTQHLMSSIRNIREGAILFPLTHQDDQWVFSKESSVEVTIGKDMGLVAAIIFNNIVEDAAGDAFGQGDDSSPSSITLRTWMAYFDTPLIGMQSFRLMFMRQGSALQKQAVTREQFIASFKSILNTRNVLANRLQGFQNLTTLAKTAVSFVVWFIVLFVVADIFGYNVGNILTAMSALLIGTAFAISKTISRVVESVVFIFGGKPYQVNDAVNIDNTWYKVHKIGVLETKFLDANNKLTRYSNQYLCDVKIVNLTNSGTCVTTIAIQIAQDTPVELIERLKSSLVKYTIENAEHWKPRVTVFLNDLTRTHAVDMEIRVESVYKYVDGGAFRAADTDLKNHVRKKMTKLGIQFKDCPQVVTVHWADAGGVPVPTATPHHVSTKGSSPSYHHVHASNASPSQHQHPDINNTGGKSSRRQGQQHTLS
ncbi:Mechanosensitive ion channel MscS domain-containing protein [Plasmodiophora brassicae]